MAFHDKYGGTDKIIEHPIDIKEEKIDLDDTSNQANTSTDPNTEDSVDEFKKTLSYDEIVAPIEMVQQLQKALTDTNEGKIKEENEREIKQEGVLTPPGDCLDNQQSHLQKCDTRLKSVSKKIFEDENENTKSASSDLVSSITSDLYNSLSSDAGSTAEDLSFFYKEVDGVLGLKQENSESKRDLISSAVNVNDFQDLEQYSYPIKNTEKDVDKFTARKTDVGDCGSAEINIKGEDIEAGPISHSSIELDTSNQQWPKDWDINSEPNKRKKVNHLNEGKLPFRFHFKQGTFIHRRRISFEFARKFTQSSSVKLHIRTHSEQNAYKCEVCEYKCTTSVGLKLHCRTHTGTQSGNLKDHMRTHTGEKPYKCQICGYKFTQSGNLKRHIRTHTGEKPYTCKLCEYKCNQSGTLKDHIRTHTGEKPYKCQICGYICAVSSSLKTHLKIHTGEKPYKCELCEYKCSVSGKLKQHMLIHKGEEPYKCQICEYKFPRKANLEMHLRIHTGEKPYKYRQSGDLIQHTKTHVQEILKNDDKNLNSVSSDLYKLTNTVSVRFLGVLPLSAVHQIINTT